MIPQRSTKYLSFPCLFQFSSYKITSQELSWEEFYEFSPPLKKSCNIFKPYQSKISLISPTRYCLCRPQVTNVNNIPSFLLKEKLEIQRRLSDCFPSNYPFFPCVQIITRVSFLVLTNGVVPYVLPIYRKNNPLSLYLFAITKITPSFSRNPLKLSVRLVCY